MNRAWLRPEDFRALIRLGPLVSMDLVVEDAQGRILVGLRRNRPAQGWWFVPGGRMAKGERLDEAFRRITAAELGRSFARSDTRFLGLYEHFYEDNWFGEDEPTHYVVQAYAWRLEGCLDLPADQHADHAWMTPAELRAHPRVHPNTQAYFQGT